MTRFTILKANNYIESNKNIVNLQYYPTAHLAAPIGWINDPNGVCFFNNLYHVFYQYYPYDSVWGPMHWGHSVSSDLINWEFIHVSLAPDQSYDKDGCFSGSSIVNDDKLYLMYTGHIIKEKTNEIIQVQNIAMSEDAENFEKSDLNPIIDSGVLPSNIKKSDFRDPKLFKNDGCFYVIVGAKTLDDKGVVLLFESNDLFNWKFKSECLSGYSFLGSMVECPDYFKIKDKDYMIFSVMDFVDKDNKIIPHKTFISSGLFDFDNGKFVVENTEELDYGKDFYAPQSMANDKNERILFAWMQNWTEENFLNKMGHKWSGQMIVPRKLSVNDGIVVQDFAFDLAKVTHEYDLNYVDNGYALKSTAQILKLDLQSDKDFKMTLYNDFDEYFIVNVKNSSVDYIGSRIANKNNNYLSEPITFNSKIECITLILDNSSIEIKINNQYDSKFFSYTIFPTHFWSRFTMEGLDNVVDYNITAFIFEKGDR